LNGENNFRHELKYLIPESAYTPIKNRVRAVMKADSHAERYRVTSLYFDDIYRSAYNDKLAGAKERRKFRVRAYELDKATLRFEIKYKDGEYAAKKSAPITPEQYAMILKGDYGFAENAEFTALDYLYVSDKLTRPRPVILTDYYREAYVCGAGNVRVTFDSLLSTCHDTLDMFAARFSRVLSGVILEIKYDAFLPAHIADLFSGFTLYRESASKFMFCADKLTEVKRCPL